MRRSLFTIALIVCVLFVAAAVVWMSQPKLLPTYLVYDLVGRRVAPLPPDVEQLVVQSGANYCARGHDTKCGGYRVVGWHTLAADPAAWCVDYVMLRRNLGRLGNVIYWANIPSSMLITRTGGGYESTQVNNCREANAE